MQGLVVLPCHSPKPAKQQKHDTPLVLQVKEARDYDVRQLRDMKMSVNIQATIRKIAMKTQVKTKKARFPWLFQMEAGGIEPPSRDTSDPASTCLANCCLSCPTRSSSTAVRCASLEPF